MIETPVPPVRPKPSRRAVAFVLAVDLAIGGAVGFSVYFATRRFGPPTPPRDLQASAALCLPEECREITPSVTIRWAPPVAGGEVTGYVVRRGGEEIGQLGASALTLTDPDVAIGKRYGYEVLAIGEEGRGRPSAMVDVRVPPPPIEHAHFGGAYDVVLVFRRIDLLTRFEGVANPAVGDRSLEGWDLLSVCPPLEGACDVGLFGFELIRSGRTYRGTLPSDARCGNERVTSKKIVTLRVTEASVVGKVLIASRFKGVTTVDFRCGGDDVHAVASFTGTRAESGVSIS